MIFKFLREAYRHIPDQYQEGSGRGQNGAGLDLAQKLPIYVKHSIRNGSLLRGVQEGSKGGPRETREGVHKQVQDEVREEDQKDVREDDHQKCLDVKTQIWNS